MKFEVKSKTSKSFLEGNKPWEMACGKEKRFAVKKLESESWNLPCLNLIVSEADFPQIPLIRHEVGRQGPDFVVRTVQDGEAVETVEGQRRQLADVVVAYVEVLQLTESLKRQIGWLEHTKPLDLLLSRNFVHRMKDNKHKK